MNATRTSPTRHASVQSFDLNAISDDTLLDAMRTVITYTIADVFALTEDEILWANYHIGDALQVFKGYSRNVIASAVMYELETSYYSQKLEQHIHLSPEPRVAENGVACADIIDWSTVLTDVATSTFRARPIVTVGFIGKIAGMLSELGVGNVENPRASSYLPNAIRCIMH